VWRLHRDGYAAMNISICQGPVKVGCCRSITSKPVLKAPETMLLTLKYDERLSNFAFNFDLRRYVKEQCGDCCIAQSVHPGDNVEVGPGTHSLPRHWIIFSSRSEGSK